MPIKQFDDFPWQVYMERVKTSTSAWARTPAGDVENLTGHLQDLPVKQPAILQEIHWHWVVGGSLFGWAQVWKITTVEGRVICFLFDSPENWRRDPKMAIFVGPFSSTAPFLSGFCRFRVSFHWVSLKLDCSSDPRWAEKAAEIYGWNTLHIFWHIGGDRRALYTSLLLVVISVILNHINESSYLPWQVWDIA